ncbi:MAG: hypothetical protein APR63_06530 [Desulfuromonas sp. SDB]|nr:MAG: hypothetical protein APR63_06530 [Desulfuromonas sp. SDB]
MEKVQLTDHGRVIIENSSKYLIELDQVSFNYGSNKALVDVCLNVGPGIYGLLGPNGAGKTTLLKILLGFLNPHRGSVKIMGRDVFKQGKYIRENIGYMPESECLIPDICGVDLVSYLGTLSGMPPSEAMKRAHEVLYYVGLDDERYRMVGSFSTGMKQRLKLAQALVHDPKILFLDEPTSGMDPKGRKELLDLIRDIVKEKPINIIFSTHLLHDVEYTCNHVIILNRGRVLSVDSLENITKLETVSYQLKLSSNPEKFIEKINQLGIQVVEMDKGILQIMLSREQNARKLFEISRECGNSIVHFKEGSTSLEEKFIETIEGDHVD